MINKVKIAAAPSEIKTLTFQKSTTSGDHLVDDPVAGASLPDNAFILRTILSLDYYSLNNATCAPTWVGVKCGGQYIIRTGDLWNNSRIAVNYNAATGSKENPVVIYDPGGGNETSINHPVTLLTGGALTFSTGGGFPFDTNATISVWIEYIEIDT